MNRDSRDQSITSDSPVYITDCHNANPVFRLLALNLFDHLCVTLARLGTIAILAILTLDRYNEKTVGSGGKLRVFLAGVCKRGVRE